jgi:hypothetical protein
MTSAPAHRATPLEPIEHGRDRAAAQPERLGGRAGGHRPMLVEEVQAALVGRVDPEPPGDRVVDRRDR